MLHQHQMVDFCQKMQNSNSRKIALIVECGDMPTIKDALGSINKLSCKEQESLKKHVFNPTFVKTLNIEEFVTKERFSTDGVCPLCWQH
jgi:hypothetical protein